MQFFVKREKEKYRDAPLWIARTVINGQPQQFAAKKLRTLVRMLEKANKKAAEAA
ncbi:hypothetical protein GJQ54_05160 [Oceanospirillaceae bacterium ASx5O]|nr:hypothetical protein GJQ54_05160 [Oceanospirillaceae bacterium ASx5O]